MFPLLTFDRFRRERSRCSQQGNEVVRQIVQAMAAIDEGPGKVAEIVPSSKGLRFETDIPALNATVEAARASKQRHGFTVVASDERSLAQRSLTAPKEN